MTKKIVLITRNFFPENTGFANSATSFYEVLCEMPGIDVNVITLARCSHFQNADPRVFRATGENSLMNKFFRLITSIISKMRICPSYVTFMRAWLDDWLMYQAFKRVSTVQRPDHIIFETNVFPFLGPRLIKEHGDKVSMRLHSTEDMELLYYTRSFKYKSLAVKNRVFRFCWDVSNVYSTNTYHLKFFKEKILGNNPLVTYDKSYGVIPNAVKEKKVFDVSGRLASIIPQKYALFLGKLSREGWQQKGLGDIISALVYTDRKPAAFPFGIPQDFRLVVIGKGPMEAHFIELVTRHNLDKYIIHLKETQQEETNWLVSHSSFVMVPSRFEGQSMFLTEALCAGKPLITTQDTGSSDLVSNDNGYLVDIGDVQQLANACFDLWKADQKKINKMGKNSRALYNRAYTYKMMAEKVKELLVS